MLLLPFGVLKLWDTLFGSRMFEDNRDNYSPTKTVVQISIFVAVFILLQLFVWKSEFIDNIAKNS